MTPTAQTPNVTIVTQEDLLKSLATIEGKPAPTAAEPTRTTETIALEKSLTNVRRTGTEAMNKALDVSPTLNEFAGLIGSHVDLSLEAMQKHVTKQNEVALAVVTVLESMKKSLDDLKTEVAALGKKPGTPAAAANQGTPATVVAVLQKNGDGQVDPAKLRSKVLHGLEKLVKSAASGSLDQGKYVQAVAKFESAGQIADDVLRDALAAADGK